MPNASDTPPPRARAVFLDRDGVLIRTIVRDGKPYAIGDDEPAVILDGASEACARLKQAGFLLVLVTNQPDIARGKMRRDFVDATNARLGETLGLDDLRVCPHDDADDCACRKPRPGLMTAAALDLGIDLAASFMVGDRWRDIEAGQAAGCRTVFIDCGYHEQLPALPDHVAGSLAQGADWILSLPR